MADDDDRHDTDGGKVASDLAAQLPGETLSEKIEARFDHLKGTALAADTSLWNLVHAFKEDVKTLVAAH